ncbi:LOW QUALITY PROTEIN: maltase-glucoamylase-like [Paramacrobiotus metropolitanus]|uniref:LOW QUALITY PROTEIN: maltase-glucoamylase-like n=1 Tax=Paramacrobiotus metropolitanus TaxID=2943436 RepID=UPI002445E494|nr:LOW QUALITY PROTEIN: maltase-glucoamylase-like [Paramacrobiotus metropolitanus]
MFVLCIIGATARVTLAVLKHLAQHKVPEILDFVEVNLRISCTPDKRGREARQFSWEACRDRGCQFRDDDLPTDDGRKFGPPVCYMSPKKVGYTMQNAKAYQPGNWSSVGVLRAIHKPIVFDPQRSTRVFRTPAFRSDYLSEDTLRFQLFDKDDADRYEVPVAVNNVRMDFDVRKLPYEISIINDDGDPFAFAVYRKSFGSKSAILDTSLGGLVLQDQFLQFSTKLPSENLFGLGDNRLGSLNRSLDWYTWAIFNRDVDILMMESRDSAKSKNLYGFQPFYMVIENDGRAHGVFLRNSNAMDYTLLPGKTITWRTVGGILDFYIFFGPTPEEVVQQYTNLVGRTFMPPYWALGFQIGKWGMDSVTDTENLITRNRDQRIPFDMVFVDINYMDDRQPFTLSPNYTGFHEISTGRTESMGIKYGGIIFPSVHVDASGSAGDPYIKALQQRILITWPDNEQARSWTASHPQSLGENGTILGKAWAIGRSAYIDFLNPAAQDWLREMLTAQDTESTIFSSLWLSIAEPSCFATNQPAKDAWFITGRGASYEQATVPGWRRHWEYTLKCNPDSDYEKPPYLPAAIREWEDSLHPGMLSSQTLCMDAQHTDGKRTYKHYDVHAIYGLTQARAVRNVSRLIKSKRTLIMSTASFPGIQQFAGRWFGDIRSDERDFRYSFQWILEYSLFGNSYTGVDVCGFWNIGQYEDFQLTKELCHRWTIAGAFYPLMRAHSATTNWYHDPADMFNYLPPAFMEEVRKALDLRYRLLPYLYTLFHIAHTRGNTVVRPLHHEYPTPDMINYINPDRKQIQFFWGGALMITPVLEIRPRTAFIDRVNILFPPDVFYDFFTGQTVNDAVARSHGPVSYPLTDVSIGLHGRAGHIIVTQATNGQLNTRERSLRSECTNQFPRGHKSLILFCCSRKYNFTVVVFPKLDQYSYGEFYWDDGDSLGQ